jgi:hypothetical protein
MKEKRSSTLPKNAKRFEKPPQPRAGVSNLGGTPSKIDPGGVSRLNASCDVERVTRRMIHGALPQTLMEWFDYHLIIVERFVF